jgi:hypothetical protein
MEHLVGSAGGRFMCRLFKHLFTGTMLLTGDPHFLMHYACSTWLPGTAPIIDF